MTIDGTFRLGAFKTIEGFEWGVTELPANADGMRSNYASYFANAIAASDQGEKLEAVEEVPGLHHLAGGDGDLARRRSANCRRAVRRR